MYNAYLNEIKNNLNIYILNIFYFNYVYIVVFITMFLCASKIYFSLKFEKNIDNFKDTKNYIYIYFSILNISLIYIYIFNFKMNIFFIFFFLNFLTTAFFVISYICLDPFKFSLSLSGFSQKKNWLKNIID